MTEYVPRPGVRPAVRVLDLVSQVRNVVLMNIYLDLGNPRGSGFWSRGVYEPGEGNGKSVYEQPGYEVDGSCQRCSPIL